MISLTMSSVVVMRLYCDKINEAMIIWFLLEINFLLVNFKYDHKIRRGFYRTEAINRGWVVVNFGTLYLGNCARYSLDHNYIYKFIWPIWAFSHKVDDLD